MELWYKELYGIFIWFASCDPVNSHELANSSAMFNSLSEVESNGKSESQVISSEVVSIFDRDYRSEQ